MVILEEEQKLEDAKLDDSEDAKSSYKRKLSTPEQSTQKEKISRSEAAANAVMLAEDFGVSTPKVTKQITPKNLNLVSKCANLGLNGSPVKVDSDYLHTMFIQLEARVTRQEEETQELKQQLAQKEEQIGNLQEQLRQKTTTNEVSEDHDFLSEVKREFPLMSQACADLETAVGKMKTDIEKMVSDTESVQNDLEENVNELNSKIERINPAVPAVAGSGGTIPRQVGQANLAAMDDELKRVGEEVDNINDRPKKHRRRAHLEGDKRDQYSRRELLRVTGVPYRPGENTNTIMVKIAHSLGVYISAGDISVSHRSGRSVSGNPRPILCKFVRRDIKNQILANKMRARNIKTDPQGNPVRIYVYEDLTYMRAMVCKKLREDKVAHFTREGKVYIAPPNPSSDDDFKVYDTPQDWEKLEWHDSVKTDVGIYPKD